LRPRTRSGVVDDGTVKTLSECGFGFISGQDGREYFFHRSGVRGEFHDLAKGDPETFEVEEKAPKGPRAKEVRRVAA
jgi:CspA family cold shock protein